ncbi:MAG TPA: DUF6502 family protein [Myxococcota bacterium]
MERLHRTLAHAVRTLLRPLVRILLRNGVPFATFCEHAKQAYVDAAGELAVPGRKPSISRIAVVTGLTRKEVSRLLKTKSEEAAPVERYNRAARVVSAWVREAAFRDASGRPAALPVEGRRSFAELVRCHGGDVPSRAVLDELVRVGAVAHTRDGRVRLVTRAYVPRDGDEEKLAILGTDVSDLVSSIDHNLVSAPEAAFFQRKVAYDNLVAPCLPELRGRARRRSQALLEQLDAFMARHDRDANPKARGEGGNRAVLGIYYYEESTEDAAQ